MLLVGLVLLGFRIMDPFIVPLIWAGILGFVSWPLYRMAGAQTLNGRTTLAAVIMTILVSAAVIVPIAWLAVVLRIELIRGYHDMQATCSPAGCSCPRRCSSSPGSAISCADLTASASPQDPHARIGLELRKLTDHLLRADHATSSATSGRNAVKLGFAVNDQ